MSTELRKRIITSIVFFIIAILLILINKIIFAIGIFVIITISFLEWNKINYKYFSKKKKKCWGRLSFYFFYIKYEYKNGIWKNFFHIYFMYLRLF